MPSLAGHCRLWQGQESTRWWHHTWNQPWISVCWKPCRFPFKATAWADCFYRKPFRRDNIRADTIPSDILTVQKLVKQVQGVDFQLAISTISPSPQVVLVRFWGFNKCQFTCDWNMIRDNIKSSCRKVGSTKKERDREGDRTETDWRTDGQKQRVTLQEVRYTHVPNKKHSFTLLSWTELLSAGLGRANPPLFLLSWRWWVSCFNNTKHRKPMRMKTVDSPSSIQCTDKFSGRNVIHTHHSFTSAWNETEFRVS